MWKSGITFRQRSAAASCKVAAMLAADAARFAWLSGTILGREVVPEVCRIKAVAVMGRGAASASRTPPNANAPAFSPSTMCSTGTPDDFATSMAGDADPASTTSADACKSLR